MPCRLKFQSRLCFIASLLVASSANKRHANNAFLPSSKIQLKSVHDKIVTEAFSKVLFDMRGGGDRGYGNDRYEDDYGRDDDYSKGYGYNSQSTNEYEDDRYGDRNSDRRGSYDDDYYGNDRENAPEVSSV